MARLSTVGLSHGGHWGTEMEMMNEMLFFSPTTLGAYSIQMHGNAMPADVVPVAAEEWRLLLAALASNAKTVGASADGYPILIDPPPPDAAEIEAFERDWRNAQLASTDTLVLRHRDELEQGAATLSVEQYQELQLFRRQLRTWPKGREFPASTHRPPAPLWLAAVDPQRPA